VVKYGHQRNQILQDLTDKFPEGQWNRRPGWNRFSTAEDRFAK